MNWRKKKKNICNRQKPFEGKENVYTLHSVARDSIETENSHRGKKKKFFFHIFLSSSNNKFFCLNSSNL
jgi:ribosome biogenesis protein Nip4